MRFRNVIDDTLSPGTLLLAQRTSEETDRSLIEMMDFVPHEDLFMIRAKPVHKVQSSYV